MSHLRLLSKQIIHKQNILFLFDKIRFMGHLILGSSVQLHPIHPPCLPGLTRHYLITHLVNDA
jgi:hypothetical protein